MFKVSIVGHSQVPRCLEISCAEIKCFRALGGRADSFFKDIRLLDVCNWKHDLSILWIGSNDIAHGINPSQLTAKIKEIVRVIEQECGAIVCVCLIEPRFYSGERPISTSNYKKVQHSVNRKLKRVLNNQVIHFNSLSYSTALSGDGVHWSKDGREKVEGKLKTVIKGHMRGVGIEVEDQ